MQAGTFLISIISFLTRQPTVEHLELLEPTVALFITYDQLQEPYCDFPEFKYTDRLLIEKYYVLSEQRATQLHSRTDTERNEFAAATLSYRISAGGDAAHRLASGHGPGNAEPAAQPVRIEQTAEAN